PAASARATTRAVACRDGRARGALPGWRARRRPRRMWDAHMALIAVVGAGAAGAMAAHLLRERGHAVVVVEARGRIGGRVWSRPRPSTVERGAQVIHGGGEELWALLRRARLRTRRVDVPMALRV